YVSVFYTIVASTHIYTLSLHDALPICFLGGGFSHQGDIVQHRGDVIKQGKKAGASHTQFLCLVERRIQWPEVYGILSGSSTRWSPWPLQQSGFSEAPACRANACRYCVTSEWAVHPGQTVA